MKKTKTVVKPKPIKAVGTNNKMGSLVNPTPNDAFDVSGGVEVNVRPTQQHLNVVWY